MSETIGKRIFRKRKELNITQKDISAFVGVSNVAVSRWEKDETIPKGRYLNLLAEKLECSLNWLLHGRDEDKKPLEKGYRTVPIISFEQAIQSEKEYKDWWHTGACSGSNTYALIVKGNSMFAAQGNVSIPEGATVIVDPDREAKPNDFVIAHIKGSSEAVLKQLIVDGPNTYLMSLNQAYKAIEIDNNCRIIGVVKRVEFDL